jgi:tetratricopeptide (TPR) repeat protein
MDAERLSEAEQELALTLKLNPGQSDAYANFGHIQFRQKNWEKAVEEFDRAIGFGSNKSDTFYFAGLSRIKQGAKVEAIPFFQKASRIQPHKAHYHFELGNVYRDLKYFDEALHEFLFTLTIQPNHPQAQNNIGVIYWNLKAYDKAEVAFKKALGMQQNLPEIHYNLANLYLRNNQTANAIPHLEQVLNLQPENTSARKLLNHALAQKGSS